MFPGLKTVDAGTASIAIQLQVPFASLLAAIVFKDKLGWRRALGMAIAFIGVAVIAGEPRLAGQYLALGFVIIASFFWAIVNLQIKLLRPIYGMSLNTWVDRQSVLQVKSVSVLLGLCVGRLLKKKN